MAEDMKCNARYSGLIHDCDLRDRVECVLLAHTHPCKLHYPYHTHMQLTVRVLLMIGNYIFGMNCYWASPATDTSDRATIPLMKYIVPTGLRMDRRSHGCGIWENTYNVVTSAASAEQDVSSLWAQGPRLAQTKKCFSVPPMPFYFYWL